MKKKEYQIKNRTSKGFVEDSGITVPQKALIIMISLLFFMMIFESVIAMTDPYLIMLKDDYWNS